MPVSSKENVRQPRVLLRIFELALGISTTLAVTGPPTLAQQRPPDGAVILVGTVRDNRSDTVVAGALVSTGERGPRAITDSLGIFRLRGVPTGPQTVRVQRFGYTDAELAVTVGETPLTLDIRLEPNPVQLEGLMIAGSTRAALRGRVIDAVSGEPVPWPSLSLTPDAVREVARASGDDAGIFDMPDVRTGTYLLRIDKLGYQSVFVTIEHGAPPQPVDVTLQRDSVVMKGVALMTHEYRRRRNAVAASVRFIGEEQLRYSAAPSVRAFLEYEAGLFFSPCGPGSAGPDCISQRGGVASPKLFIDDLQWDLDVLWSFNTSELHAVEVFRCRRPEIRLYTIEYLERMARRPRIPLPACSFW